jgi:hypothetical protein
MRVLVVPELNDLLVPIERGLDDAPLDAAAASVHQTDLAQTGRRRGVDVLGDNRGNVARGERVEIDLAFDRNAHRIIGHVYRSALRAVLRLDDGLDAPTD